MHRLSHHSIHDCGDSQLALLPAPFLSDQPPSDRLETVGPCFQLLSSQAQQFLLAAFELLDRHPVYSSCTGILSYLLPCLTQSSAVIDPFQYLLDFLSLSSGTSRTHRWRGVTGCRIPRTLRSLRIDSVAFRHRDPRLVFWCSTHTLSPLDPLVLIASRLRLPTPG